MDEEAGTWAKTKTLGREIYRIWIGERPGPLAASLAYYTIFSIVPITYLTVVIAGVFVDASELITKFEDWIDEVLGPEAVEQLSSAVDALADRTAQGTTIGSLISFIVLLFSASLIFFQLQYVLNFVWQAPSPNRDETRSYVRNRLLAFVMVFSVGLILILAVVVNFVISIITTIINFEVTLYFANFIAIILIITVFLAIIYKFLPNVVLSWHDVLVGSAATALALVLVLQIFGLLLSFSTFDSALQAAGSVALFLISFYFLATIFVLGAVFTRAYAQIFGSQITPRLQPIAEDD